MTAVVALFSYLLGSIPFGLLLGRLKGVDIRTAGSRNIGATNLWRVCGWRLGLAGFVLDFAKGLAAALIAASLLPQALPHPYQAILAAVASVLGHNYPVWLKFKGGKGVATSAGAVAGLMLGPFLLAMAVFVLTVFLSRYISLGSMLASAGLVAGCLILLPRPFGADLPLFLLACALCVMLVARHRQNIARILAGTENRFPPPRKTGE